MPLEYFSTLHAGQVLGQQEAMEDPRVRMLPMPKNLYDKIRTLPLKTQMQLLTEIQYAPEVMRPRIMMLLAAKDPFKAIFADQVMALSSVYRPGSVPPDYQALWPVLQKYARAAIQTGVADPRNAPPNLMLDKMEMYETLKGLGAAVPVPAWKTSPHRRLTFHDMTPFGLEGLGDTFGDMFKQVTDWYNKDGKDLYDKYGEPLLKKTIGDVTGVESGPSKAEIENAAANAELAARLKAAEAQEKARTSGEEEPKKTSWLLPLALIGGAAAIFLPLTLLAVKKS